jgi:hypothetical protein
MPTFEKLPRAKLSDFTDKEITIEKVISGNSTGPYAGPYVLLITATESIISSHKVVMEQALELKAKGKLPATRTVRLVTPKVGDFEYFSLE